jgi:hypothetical protein
MVNALHGVAYPASFLLVERWSRVDTRRFDDLIKRLSTASMPRSHALRVLGASAAALAGVRLTAAPGVARKRNNNEPKRRVCHCGRNNPQRVGCKTKRLPKDKVKKHLKRHKDDYRGRCVAATPITVPNCVGQSGACTADAQCCSGICNVRDGQRPDTCTTCRTARADCTPGAGNGCCARLICSATVPDNENRCCVEDGNLAPGGCPPDGRDRRCCSGFCAPPGTDDGLCASAPP